MSDIQLPPRYEAVHASGGILLYVALGAAWALVGLLELRPVGTPWINLFLGVTAAVLLIFAMRSFQRASELPEDEVSEEQQRERASRSRRSHRVLTAQGVAITVISAGLILAGRPGYIAAATSLVVGLHFMALAAIHHAPGEYLVGGLLIAVAVGAMYLIPRAPTIPDGVMNVVAGFGTAIILWVSSIVRLVRLQSNLADPAEG
jgi:phosphatidylglycerophosphate synthase